MSLILKAEFNGEIRRVGLRKENDASVETLEAKLRSLFPQLTEPFSMTCASGDFHTDDDVRRAFAEAANKKPPMVRVSIAPNFNRVPSPATLPVDVEYVQIPSPITDWASVPPSVALGHKCRLCDADLGELHYKCLNCLDFEICPQCEDAQVHDSTHLFVKMRCHADDLSLKRQLIFKSHIDNPNERELAREEKKKLRQKKIEIESRKKEVRDAERKKRAQEKLKRLQARKEKVSNKKVKLGSTEKKKATAVSKVKRAKKIVSTPPIIEEVVEQPTVVIEEVETVAEPQEEEVSTSFIELPQETKKDEKPDFSFLRLISEFQFLREAETSEPKVEIELQEIREETEPSTVVIEEVVEEDQAPEEEEEQAPQPVAAETPFAKNLKVLEDMGFTDREKNIALLVKNVGNLDETINQLLNPQPFAALSRWLPFAIGL